MVAKAADPRGKYTESDPKFSRKSQVVGEYVAASQKKRKFEVIIVQSAPKASDLKAIDP